MMTVTLVNSRENDLLVLVTSCIGIDLLPLF